MNNRIVDKREGIISDFIDILSFFLKKTSYYVLHSNVPKFMNDIIGFAPIAHPSATLLILGSMPSEASLSQQEYYAHQRNAFWLIMLNLLIPTLDIDKLTYPQRKMLLIEHHIALWDVLQHCYRAGSLDSAIAMKSIKANDFTVFFMQHSAIKKVCFNGAKAETIYMKTVFPLIKEQFSYLEYVRLPSTSPAHAALSFQDKLAIWQHSIVNDVV